MDHFLVLPDEEKCFIKSNYSVVVAQYLGQGGPPTSSVDKRQNKIDPTPTGEFIVARIQQHLSGGKYPLSMIPWGTEFRLNNMIPEVYLKGKWVPTESIHPDLTLREIVLAFGFIYSNLTTPRPNKLPNKWIYNDFGPKTVYMYKDTNHNGKFDPGAETIMQEMFHTTPDNEMQVLYKETVVLDDSHGCIHVHPKHMRTMIAKKYFKVGGTVFIHSYKEDVPKGFTISPNAKPPYIVHFYPKSRKILVCALGEKRV